MNILIDYLKVENFVLADSVEIYPQKGLNVFTGETGAGKSLIVDAISFVCGERLGTYVNRDKDKKTRVEISFDLSYSIEILNKLKSMEIYAEDGQIIIVRELLISGKSIYKINDSVYTASLIKEVTSYILDIHGQHEHQSLLSNTCHLEIIDSLSEKTNVLLNDLSLKYSEIKRLKTQLADITKASSDISGMIDLYMFQEKEISSAKLKAEELEKLEMEYERLRHIEKIKDFCCEAYELLSREEGGVIDYINTAENNISKACVYDQRLEAINNELSDASSIIDDVIRDLQDYISDIDDEPGLLESVYDRLSLIRTIKNKYGGTIESTLKYYDEIKKKIAQFSGDDFNCDILNKKIELLESELSQISIDLSNLRKRDAKIFEADVTANLRELAMGNVTFKVDFSVKNISSNGFDQIDFLISPNLGMPLMPLAKTASGGELSRISLAIKTATRLSSVPILIFDEIDAGISGLTGEVLGKKLLSLSNNCQILCVTHLTQVASKANTHFYVEKAETEHSTTLKVKELNMNERITEITRMLGDTESNIAKTHAKEILRLGN